MYINLKGKKILILGGAYQHLKIVEKAREMEIITYVTDFLEVEKSPAKQLADYQYMYNVTDIDALFTLCQREHIDGIIAPYLDITQKPYQVLCEKLGFPCFGNKKQFQILTDKNNFKEFCENFGGDIIPYYRESDILDEKICNEKVKFPILIKPCDSRGSRGQSICYNRNEAIKAIHFAKSESFSKNIVIEEYMRSDNDLQLVYIVIDGEPILVRVEDRYLGNKGTGLDKLSIASIEPSIYEQEYREFVNEKTISMIKALGLKNSPVFLQGFWDGETVRFYDPGIRLPGDEYDRIYKSVTGIDLPELMIWFALTGKMSSKVGKKIKYAKINKATAMLYLAVKPGKIIKIEGLEEIKANACILAFFQMYKEGDTVFAYNNVKQRFGEVDIECEGFEQLQKVIDWLFDTLHVFDEKGEDMLFAKFDTEILEKYKGVKQCL
ncbi:hypothetical protein D5278_20355 [bacterium 1XD21-13]|nr:hypothetical protein [bacterium 1XD21-13]